MSEKTESIALSDFLVGLKTTGGLTLFRMSDAFEGGGYMPTAEIHISNDSLVKLRDYLKDIKSLDELPF